jgi:hypothetical protein
MGAVWDTQCNSLTFLRPPWCRTNRATTWNLARGLPEVTLQEINERLLEKRFSDLGDGNSNMILETLFHGENLPILFGVSTVLFLLIFEAGYRIGRKRRTSIDEATKAWVTAIYSAILTMLGLLLGFSYSMAQQRFDVRKQLVVEEANAIGEL